MSLFDFYYNLFLPNVNIEKINELKKDSINWFNKKLQLNSKKLQLNSKKLASDKKSQLDKKSDKILDKTNIKKYTIQKNIWDYLNNYNYAIYYGGYQLFHEYITKLFSKEEYDEYITKLYKFKKAEQKLILARKYFHSNSEFSLKTKTTCQYKYQNIPISVLYDENGIKHKWDIYCYEDEELTLKQLKEKDNW